MKTLKTLVAALVILMSVNTMAHNSNKEPVTGSSPKGELEDILKELPMGNLENVTVTVYFRLSDDKRIEYVKADSEHRKLNSLIEKRLMRKKLFGKKWTAGVVYELPLRIQL